jgi:hypothetical membrane protein
MTFLYTPMFAATGASSFRGAIQFFERLGLYDVILPFLLVFTLVYAIFDRTKVLGTEKFEDMDLPKKNLNAMIAFVIAFLVIASAQMVAIINTALPMIVILLFLGVFFLLLVGIFYSEKEEVLLSDRWRILFMAIMFVGIVAIFLYAIPTKAGYPVLYVLIDFILNNYNTAAVSSIILMVIVIGFMLYIIRDPSGAKKAEKDSD